MAPGKEEAGDEDDEAADEEEDEEPEGETEALSPRVDLLLGRSDDVGGEVDVARGQHLARGLAHVDGVDDLAVLHFTKPVQATLC